MNRVYGHHTCFLCGKTPSIGWLYSCRQDQEMRSHRTSVTDPDTLPEVPNDSDWFDVQARIAESLGMSVSVVKGIRRLDYSFDQVDK